MPTTERPGPLLVVDDAAEVRQSLRRYFARYVDRVLVAGTPAEAEGALRSAPVTALLCDYWLGAEHPPATALIPGWRAAHPSVRRVVLMTGTKTSSLDGSPGVDAVFHKPFDLEVVRAFLFAPFEP